MYFLGIFIRILMVNGKVLSCIMEIVLDIYRVIDFFGFMFVIVIFVIV